jgi:hypothetical protein
MRSFKVQYSYITAWQAYMPMLSGPRALNTTSHRIVNLSMTGQASGARYGSFVRELLLISWQLD